jgi:hypothetical protein
VIGVHENLDELLRSVYKEWGYRPIYAALVSREEKRPRVKVSSMGPHVSKIVRRSE